MPVIEAPTIVKRTINERFSSLFKNEPQRKYLANFVIGLIISPNKTVARKTNGDHFPHVNNGSRQIAHVPSIGTDTRVAVSPTQRVWRAARTGSFGAGAGTTTPGTVGRRTGTGMIRATGTTALASAWP